MIKGIRRRQESGGVEIGHAICKEASALHETGMAAMRAHMPAKLAGNSCPSCGEPGEGNYCSSCGHALN